MIILADTLVDNTWNPLPTAHLDVCKCCYTELCYLWWLIAVCKFMTQILFWSTLIISSQFQAIKKM